jgi:hypothetical protein
MYRMFKVYARMGIGGRAAKWRLLQIPVAPIDADSTSFRRRLVRMVNRG